MGPSAPCSCPVALGRLRAAGRSPSGYEKAERGCWSLLSHSSPHTPAPISPHSWAKPHGGEREESSSGSKGAPAGKLPGHTAGVGQRANVTADTTSALLRSPPSITNRDELARCLIQSLDINRICLNMFWKLKKAQHSTAAVLYGDVREEYLVCLQCRRCPVGSCPHHREPAAEEDLPVLAIILHTAHILRYEETKQLEMGLGFELTMAGDLLYMWDRTQRIPEIAPERCCEVCNVPLPRSPGDGERSQASFPALRAQGTQRGPLLTLPKAPSLRDALGPQSPSVPQPGPLQDLPALGVPAQGQNGAQASILTPFLPPRLGEKR